MKSRAWLLIVLALLSLRCGYRLSGRGNNLPPAARTIAIPDFKNQTPRPQAEQFITFAVREEFIRRSKLRLVAAQADADLVLEGALVAFKTTPVAYSAAGAATLYEVRLTLDVRLIDMQSGEIFYQGKGVSFHETYEIESEDFFSQETGSLARIGARFAASIVAAVLENF